MTKQDLEQIRRYMLEKGIKDTELKAANALDGTEIWGAVQEGRSVKISTQSILNFLKPILDPNLSMFLGFYQSEDDLKGFYPTAKDGSYAWVLSPEFPDYPGEVYVYAATTGWVGTGVKASDDTKVDLKDYIESIEVDEIAKLPDYTASRAISDGSGNNIEETYIRRDEVIDGTVKGDKGDDGDSWFIIPSTYIVGSKAGEDNKVYYKLGRRVGSSNITRSEGGYWRVSDISKGLEGRVTLESNSTYLMDFPFNPAKYPTVTTFLIEVYDTDSFVDAMAVCPLSTLKGLGGGGGNVIVSNTEPEDKSEGTIWVKVPKITASANLTSIGYGGRAIKLEIHNLPDPTHCVITSMRPDGTPITLTQSIIEEGNDFLITWIGVPSATTYGAVEAETLLRISPSPYAPEDECVYITLNRGANDGADLGPSSSIPLIKSSWTGGTYQMLFTKEITASNITVDGDWFEYTLEDKSTGITIIYVNVVIPRVDKESPKRTGSMTITKDGRSTFIPIIA